METKNVVEVDIQDEDIREEDFTPEELEDDTTDWKAKALELKGLNKRRATKLAKAKEKLATIPKPEPELKPQDKKPEVKSDEFNEGQLALLAYKGIESDEDIDFTKDELKKSNGTLRELMSNDYFQSKIKARKDAKIALDATPIGSRRSGSKTGDTIDYHFAKYQKEGGKYLQTVDSDTRDKIVNMRLKTEAADNQFTDQSVIQ